MRVGHIGLVGLPIFILAPSLTARTPTETASPVKAITSEELERLPSARNISDLLRNLPCTPQAIPTLTRPTAAGAPIAADSLSCLRPDDLNMIEIYRVHNDTRLQFGSQPLVWDRALAAAAQSYSVQLARTGRLAHAPREGRGISRENLGMGMLGWDSRQMLGNWLKEERNFTPGSYPEVSKTGDWQDVSHYTQMVWPTTTNLGCGMADGSGYRWLVCRYSPGGNKDGVRIPFEPVGTGTTIADGPKTPTPAPTPATAGADVAPVDTGGVTLPPPPPPPPTARDPAPDGDETRHPLVTMANGAFDAFAAAWREGDRAAQERELAKMRYALDELRKRLKAARKAGPYSTVDPVKVEKQVKELERTMKTAEDRFSGREERG